ncbi:MAG: tRNA lysidine(34) synthetase TilS [Bacteroidota bacterium]
MLQKVRDTIKRHQMLTKGDRVIVGFSCGIDSVCLLHVLHQLQEYELDLWALYINHSLRPSENIQEIKLLHQVGSDWGVKVKAITLDIPESLRKKPQSLQLLAREERYKLFKSFQKEINASKIALGHQRDDQAETILYRIIRGTGIDGLAGIPIVRDNLIIRPLLEVSRAEIHEYALQHQLKWLEDSSNRKPVYVRNKLRLQLIPELKESYNPNLNSVLIRLGQLAREQQELMEVLLKEKWGNSTLVQKGRIGIIVEGFLKLPDYLQYYLLKRVLHQAQPGREFESIVILRLRDKIRNENFNFKSIQLSKNLIAHNLKGTIFFKGIEKPLKANLGFFRLNAPGVTIVPELNLEVKIEKGCFAPDWKSIDEYEVYLDGVRPKLPFYLRFWRHGDAFHPLGAPGNQKLHDFFINQKVPREERNRIPLLVTADDQIVWVSGYRPNELFKVKSDTTEVWHITLKPTNPGKLK